MSAGIETERRGAVAVVRVVAPPELTADAVPHLRAALDEAIDAAGDVVLDLGSVEFIDSVGLTLIVALNRRVRRRGDDLRLVASGREVQTALELSRMHRLVEIYEDVDTAVASFGPAAEQAPA